MHAETQQQYAETFHGLHMKGHREDFAGRCDQ